jgi:hypothetical protein
LVEQFLAFAENQARQKKVMYMGDWIKKLNDILTINENEILEHAGKISHQLAVEIAESEFEKYNTRRIAAEDKKHWRNSKLLHPKECNIFLRYPFSRM